MNDGYCEKHGVYDTWLECIYCEVCIEDFKKKADKIDEIKKIITHILRPNKDFDGEVALAQTINKIIEGKSDDTY